MTALTYTLPGGRGEDMPASDLSGIHGFLRFC